MPDEANWIGGPAPWAARASRSETGEDEPKPATSEFLTGPLGVPVPRVVPACTIRQGLKPCDDALLKSKTGRQHCLSGGN